MAENIEQLAREVTIAQDRLELAKRRLLAALGEAPAAPQRGGQTRKGPSPDSVSQQTLAAIQDAPNGLTRAELLARGLSPTALHSALKKHAAMKRIVSRDGRWVAATKKKGP